MDEELFCSSCKYYSNYDYRCSYKDEYVTSILNACENYKENKKKYNLWLISVEFLKKFNFSDRYYLESLCYHVHSFLKNVPVQVITYYDKTTDSICFCIGKNKKNFKLNIEIAPYDYVTVVKRWLYQFYPKYEYDYIIQEHYSDQEIIDMLKCKKVVDLNDALLLRKPIEKKEIGVIEKVMMKEDQFIININDQRQLWITGSIKQPLTLTLFKEQLFKLQDNEERRNYIYKNARKIKDLAKDDKEIVIKYTGKQMINFFKINYEDLKNYELKQIQSYLYKWDRFLIYFDSSSLLSDCLSFVEKKNKEKIAC